jgi:hypothetical protein
VLQHVLRCKKYFGDDVSLHHLVIAPRAGEWDSLIRAIFLYRIRNQASCFANFGTTEVVAERNRSPLAAKAALIQQLLRTG